MKNMDFCWNTKLYFPRDAGFFYANTVEKNSGFLCNPGSVTLI